jgi:hypothetical protein
MIEMIGDMHVNTHKKQENIFMFSDCTARSEPIKYQADPGFQVRGGKF